MNIFLLCMEAVLAIACNVFAYTLRALTWLINIVSKVTATMLFIIVIIVITQVIDDLPIFWESLILTSLIITSAVLFIGIIALRFWKPERFFKIFNK